MERNRKSMEHYRQYENWFKYDKMALKLMEEMKDNNKCYWEHWLSFV